MLVETFVVSHDAVETESFLGDALADFVAQPQATVHRPCQSNHIVWQSNPSDRGRDQLWQRTPGRSRNRCSTRQRFGNH